MIETEEAVLIDAPLEETFAYMNRPENQPEITPSLTRSETVERRVRWEMSGDIEGEIEWEFERVGGKTRVTYAARYEMPVDVLEVVVGPVVKRYNERELRTTLENLRARIEGDGTHTTGETE